MVASVTVCVPHTGWIHHSVVKLLHEIQDSALARVEFHYPQHRPVEVARAKSVQHFLSRASDFLLFIDSDNPPKRNPLRRIADDKDVIGFPTPYVIDRKLLWNVFNLSKSDTKYVNMHKSRGLVKVDAVGSGCLLAHREVYEQVGDNPFEFSYDGKGNVLKAGDIRFCERARAKGFGIWADWDTICHHYKEVDILEPLAW